MYRDPLLLELAKLIDSYDIKHKCPPEDKITDLKNRIEAKWNVSLIITGYAQPNVNGVEIVESFKPDLPLSPIKVKEIDLKGKEVIKEAEVFLIYNRVKGFPLSSFPVLSSEMLISTQAPILTIQVDLDCITLNDSAFMRKAMWEIIKRNLMERRNAKRPVAKRSKGIILNDHAELDFVYTSKDDIFKNYLRWYDMHIREKLSFRLIALYEKTKPEQQSFLLECIKTQKSRYGISIKGEDKIEKGIRLIYKAIHRANYSRNAVTPTLEVYDCPKHGNQCPVSCTYYKEWLARFNRLTP